MDRFVCFYCTFLCIICIRKDLKYTLRSAYSARTFDILRTQFKAFLLFCAYFRLIPTPATLDTICLYVQFLSRRLSPPAICNYLSEVKLLHLFSGPEFPFTKDFVLSLKLRDIARNALHTPRRAPLVTPDVLYHIFMVWDLENVPFSRTLFCAFLITFFSMARLVNIVPSPISASIHRVILLGEISQRTNTG